MRSSVLATYHFGQSVIKVKSLPHALVAHEWLADAGCRPPQATISLDATAPSTKQDALSLIKFDVQVDWHERHRYILAHNVSRCTTTDDPEFYSFLKWEIPLAVNPTGDIWSAVSSRSLCRGARSLVYDDRSTYENQFGFIQRPTHRNTTWQRAQFEVCGHRFADVSEFGYGVALLNDSKYGHACEHSTLRLSLLRASTLPDDEQDQGTHHFSFAVLPHRGSFTESDVPAVARMFNYPLHLRRVPSSAASSHASLLGKSPDQHGQGPFTVLGARNVILDTIKRGEEDDFKSKSAGETVILRLYEAYGGSARAKIAVALPDGRKIASAELVDVSRRHRCLPCVPKLRSALKHEPGRRSSNAKSTSSSFRARTSRPARPIRSRSTCRGCARSRLSRSSSLWRDLWALASFVQIRSGKPWNWTSRSVFRMRNPAQIRRGTTDMQGWQQRVTEHAHSVEHAGVFVGLFSFYKRQGFYRVAGSGLAALLFGALPIGNSASAQRSVPLSACGLADCARCDSLRARWRLGNSFCLRGGDIAPEVGRRGKARSPPGAFSVPVLELPSGSPTAARGVGNGSGAQEWIGECVVRRAERSVPARAKACKTSVKAQVGTKSTRPAARTRHRTTRTTRALSFSLGSPLSRVELVALPLARRRASTRDTSKSPTRPCSSNRGSGGRA